MASKEIKRLCLCRVFTRGPPGPDFDKRNSFSTEFAISGQNAKFVNSMILSSEIGVLRPRRENIHKHKRSISTLEAIFRKMLPVVEFSPFHEKVRFEMNFMFSIKYHFLSKTNHFIDFDLRNY